MNRKPSTKVLKELRKQVGFACPICGSPFLTWHHFDPPWREEHHHNPDGMIALCPEHAAHADGGHFTKDQVRSLKRPLDDKDKIVSAKWPWVPEKALFLLGNSICIGEKAILSIGGVEIISFRKSALPPFKIPFFSISANFTDDQNHSVLTIKDNLLIFNRASLEDVKCPPQARYIEFSHKNDVHIKLRHNRIKAGSDFEDYIAAIIPNSDIGDFMGLNSKQVIDSEGCVPIIELEGFIKNRDVELYLERKRSSLLCKFYNNEKVVLKPSILRQSGSLNIKHGNRGIIKFG